MEIKNSLPLADAQGSHDILQDIPIMFTGTRDGEKLYEELTTPAELVEWTSHPKILKAKNHFLKDVLLKKIIKYYSFCAMHKMSNIIGNDIKKLRWILLS